MSGLCPFHSERSPSFTVFQDHFHCFGCGEGGDVITFTMKMESLDYRSAVESLAQRAGIPIPQETQSFAPRQKETLSRERGLQMNKLAARHFYDNLMKAPEAAAAREYIASRRIDGATLRHFGLGFAKNSFNDLTDFLRSNGFGLDEIKACFLCGQSEKGSYYDIFRNRIMFPIIDINGNIVAFGGRVMDDSKPKYLNSSDTPVFKKSRNLFAMNFAKNSVLGDEGKSDSISGASFDMSGKLILCEGYMDVIALHQAGFTNAVATLGTAITQEHARFVSRYAKTVYLAYDSDGAGQKATAKAISLLSEVGIDAKVINIVGAKDPDEYIKTFGKAAFARLLDGSVGQTDYRLDSILGRYNLEIPEEKIRAVTECCGMLSGIYPEFKREIYISRLSERTGVSKQSVENEIKRRERKNSAKARSEMTKTSIDDMRRYNDKVNPDAVKNPRAAEIEERILGIIMLYPEHLAAVRETLKPESFVTDFNRGVYAHLEELYDKDTFDLSYLNEFYDGAAMGRIRSMVYRRQMVSANGIQTLKELVAALGEEKHKESVKNGELSFLERIEASRRKKGIGVPNDNQKDNQKDNQND